MTHARDVLEEELGQLVAQRQRYVKAARAARSRTVVLRHLLHAERLANEIQALGEALRRMPVDDEDVTLPIVVDDETTVVFRAV